METDNYVPQYEINFSNNIVYVVFEFTFFWLKANGTLKPEGEEKYYRW
jgi:hypothetical protein